MATIFLIIIYLAFISLGIPDSLLGSAWPVMRPDVGASFGFAGVLSMVVAGGTIISSLASGALTRRLGTGTITLISCCMTAGALLGFSMAPSMAWLVLLAIPLGLGGGAIDAALNHYVAENYKAHHMNWLHCFWGVGATLGPILMSYYIAERDSWREGYSAVSVIQFSLALLLLVSLPLWKRIASLREAERQKNLALLSHDEDERNLASRSHDGDERNLASRSHDEDGPRPSALASSSNVLRLKGVKPSLVAFLFYCGVESTVGLWGASYLVGTRNLSAESAAGWIALYYGGITIGRLVTGFITLKVQNRVLIRWGQIVALAGGVLLLLPLPQLYLAGLILIGLGLAPIYPGLLHETPARFGRENSAKLMGYQMAVAYTGTTLLPPLFGLLATGTSIALFPAVVLVFAAVLMISSEKVNLLLSPRPGKGI